VDSFNIGRISREDLATIDDVTGTGAPFRTQLPILIVLGATYDPLRYLTLGISLQEGTANTPLSSTTPRAQISAEFRGLRWLPLSVDAAIGGNQGSTVGCGIGLDLKGFLLQLRLAGTRGVALSARGLRAGLALTYSSQSPGGLNDDPNILRVHSEGEGRVIGDGDDE
jgi:hypothetical protein